MIGWSVMGSIGSVKACSSGSAFAMPRKPSSTSRPNMSPSPRHPMRFCAWDSRSPHSARRMRPAHRSARSCVNSPARRRVWSRGASENKSVSAGEGVAPVSAAEAKALFASLLRFPALVLAVSGGPDSTALLLLVARWRLRLKVAPKLLAVTVDHGLRRASAGEPRAVKALARRLGVDHRTLRWTGKRPASGLQQAAREARYRLLGQAANAGGAGAIVTAHTLDDQAETVLMRMSRGSGIGGLGAMARESALPGSGRGILLVRPLLQFPKTRLIATLARAKIGFAADASNLNPRFARAALRALMPALAREGLSAPSLARLAIRLRRADAAIEAAVDDAMQRLSEDFRADHIVLDAE